VLDQAQATSKKHGYKNLLAENCKLYAEYYLGINELEQAHTCCSEGLDIAKEIGDLDMLAETYIMSGRINAQKGNIDQAIDDYNKCEEISRPIHNKYLCGVCLFHTGEAYKEKGELEKARSLFTQAKEILLALGAKHYLQQIDKIL
jgi:tetratricopeptide (TPR) repeat protein